ncbi:protein-L-histidine N-pros-methyltransferase-like [Clytia hemisphaerica]|uniref:DREV methyltransferase n=1 Tax=Clytia hemisphaerica TaxID=252671 RepID=A0A7M5X6W5_9CNID
MLGQYSRNPLVKNYLYRLAERQKPIDTEKWYYLNSEQFPAHLQSKFLQNSLDEETEEFLENCYEKSDWIFTQIFHNVFRVVLGWFMSMTTVNGLLNRGSMFVFSENQFLELLNVNRSSYHGNSYLDLGAGDGKTTGKLSKYFDQAYATEQSPTMQWRLKEKGFQILEIDQWQTPKKYSLITALNLLDRIDHPVKLVNELRTSIADDGFVILAIVLPYNPCYETGVSFRDPSQYLPICGKTIEEQIVSLHDDVFVPAGFDVVRFTRLPYLCEGDLNHDFFALNDVVFVLKPRLGYEHEVNRVSSDSHCQAGNVG